MTPEEFLRPFLRLAILYEAGKGYNATERQVLQDVWFDVFESFSPEVWEAAVERWIATQKWMPKPVELRELCYEEATRLVHEREARAERARRAALPPADPAKLAELKAKLRGLKRSMQLQGPAAAPQLGSGDDDDR